MLFCASNTMPVAPWSDLFKLESSQGFTLIEMLVVLVIIGASSAFVGPNLWKQYEKSTDISVVQKFVLEAQSLRHDAFATGKVVLLNVGGNKMSHLLPSGWEISNAQPIYFLPSGVTNGGELIFTTSSGTQWGLVLSPLDGTSKISRL